TRERVPEDVGDEASEFRRLGDLPAGCLGLQPLGTGETRTHRAQPSTNPIGVDARRDFAKIPHSFDVPSLVQRFVGASRAGAMFTASFSADIILVLSISNIKACGRDYRPTPR